MEHHDCRAKRTAATSSTIPGHSRATVFGFHGYKENAAIHTDALRRSPADRPIGGWSACRPSIASTRKGSDVVGSWMTRQDREQAIADNVAYVAAVLSELAGEFGITRPLVYAGFSQGVAMAYRAAALCSGRATA